MQIWAKKKMIADPNLMATYKKGKVTYHRKIFGAKLGEKIWKEITEKEYDRLSKDKSNGLL